MRLTQPSQSYPLPAEVEAIPESLLDLRSDAEIDNDLVNPPPVSSDKNIWMYWETGYATAHPVSKRTIRAWHRRLFKRGWTVRVVDRVPGSPSHLSNFVDLDDRELFPRVFADDAIDMEYKSQAASDLIRWPLLVRHGGVWSDIGLILIGDMDRLWEKTIANPASPHELIAFGTDDPADRPLINYFFAVKRDNPYVKRCLRLLLAVWAADGDGKIRSTTGMHLNPLVKQVPLVGAGFDLPDETRAALSDYVIATQVMTLVLGLVDSDDSWNGPQYAAKHVYAMDYKEASSLYHELTKYDGQKQFDLLSLQLPGKEETPTAEQQQAQEIVERTLRESFGLKLAHGMPVMAIGVTLGLLWRQHEGSDIAAGTYAQWLRHGASNWCQTRDPPSVNLGKLKPLKVGNLLTME